MPDLQDFVRLDDAKRLRDGSEEIVDLNAKVLRLQQVFQYKIFSEYKCSSTNYSISRGYSSTKYSAIRGIPAQHSADRDIPEQNVQPLRIFQYTIYQPIDIPVQIVSQ